MANLEDFLKGYIAAALWSSTDHNDVHLDQNYSAENLAESTKLAMRRDCASFIEKAGDLLLTTCTNATAWTQDGYAGHDFWLTRNGHGAGFWDGDWPEAGDKLTEICDTFREVDLYVGDDGLIYQMGDERYTG